MDCSRYGKEDFLIYWSNGRVVRSTLESCGSVAEWSKALVLGTSHFDDVGSNPTTAIRAGNFEA